MSQIIGGIRVLAPAIVIALCTAAPTLARDITERVSLAQDGAQGNGNSTSSAISADGRFVAFFSDATNLVPGDTNEQRDVFVYDRQTGRTERVSVGAGGVEAAGFSEFPAISADGRFVAFQSKASNLVSGDTNGVIDVFVRDRRTRTTQRVSVGPGGHQGDSHSTGATISASGRFIAFDSFATNLGPGDTNGTGDVFVHDRKMGTTQRISRGPGGVQGNGRSTDPTMSADGRFVAFDSDATNLVPGDTIDTTDVFVHDRKIGTTRRISRGPGGISGNGSSRSPAMSADGRFVTFFSDATNLVPGDTNGVRDVFVRTLPP